MLCNPQLIELFDRLGTPPEGRKLIELARQTAPVRDVKSRGGNVITYLASRKMSREIQTESRHIECAAASLARLTGDEQKSVKMTAFDLQLNPAHPSMGMHRIDQSKDKNFWSVRVSSDIRLIVHKTATSFLLCYVDHHDKAYKWAERRKLETHPKTGAAQWVEIRERIEEIAVRVPVTEEAAAAGSTKTADSGSSQVSSAKHLDGGAKPRLFAGLSDEELLAFGVPSEWLADARLVDEDSLLILADHLPAEAAEALLELATGGVPKPQPSAAVGSDPFAHPDAQRRFRVMKDVDELARALDYPCRSALKRSRMMPTLRTSTTRSETCSTWPAREPGTVCSSPAPSLRQSLSTTCGDNFTSIRQVSGHRRRSLHTHLRRMLAARRLPHCADDALLSLTEANPL